MKPFASLALLSTALLAAGCAGGGSIAPSSASRSASSHQLIKYSLPIVTSREVQSAVNRADASRSTQNSVGTIPTYTTTVAVTDAPLFGVSAINLAIMGVNAYSGNVSTPIVSYQSDVIVNVLNYQSSALALGGAPIPVQAYDGLQLVIDPSQSSIVANGVTLPLAFGAIINAAFLPSGSGPQVINYAMPFTPGSSTGSLIIDFNAEQSLRTSNGAYQAAPVLAGVLQSNAAVIEGSLVSASGAPVQGATAVVQSNGQVVAVAPSDANGNFTVHAIPAGNYTVTIENAFTTAAGMQVFASDGRTDSLPPIQASVPAGYQINLGQISD